MQHGKINKQVKLPVRSAQPLAAASETLWPAKFGKKEPPITAIGVILYKYFNSPISFQIEINDTLNM